MRNTVVPMVAILVAMVMFAMGAAAQSLDLAPWPKTVEQKSGSLELTAKSRIVATDASLLPLAKVLSEEILQTTGRRLATAQGEAAKGDIVLKLDPQLKGETNTLVVADQAVVTGGDYPAVAWGTVTLLQALTTKDDKLCLPRLKVSDSPDYNLRGIQVCFKHQGHTVEQLKQTIEMCRLYKIRYWMTHMSMRQWWMVFSKSFREKPTGYIGREDGNDLSPEEMKDLVEYARARGVAILPQFEAWHCYFYPEQVQQAAPDIFTPEVRERIKGELLQDTPEFWVAMDRLVGQIADLYHDSPYVHVGPMAGEVPGFGENALEQAYLKKYNLRHGGDYWALMYLRFDELIKKRGRKSLAWEGVDQDSAKFVKLPKDAGFASYHYGYWAGGWSGPMMIADGFNVVNCTWDPMYIISGYPSRTYYEWNARIFRPTEVDPTPLLLGAILCNWEGPGHAEIPMFRDRAAPFGERMWNSGAVRPWEDFQRRFAHTDHMLDQLLFSCPVDVSMTGLTRQEGSRRADPFYPDGRFLEKAIVTMSPVRPGVTLRYTLDGNAPTTNSPALAGSIALTRSAWVWAKAFDVAGNQVGGEYKKQFSYVPLTVKGMGDHKGVLGEGVVFKEKLQVELVTPVSGGKILYRLGSDQGSKELPYEGPLTFTRTSGLLARVVDKDGRQIGDGLTTGFNDDGFRRNLLTDPGVEVTVEPAGIGDKKFIVDGYATNPDVHWNGIGGQTAWAKFKLPMATKLNKLEVFCWWGDGRAYRYNVEVSMTGKDGEWKQIVDMKQNTKPGDGGHTHEFEPVEVRFIRINMFGNTTNGHNHLCEVRAYEAAK